MEGGGVMDTEVLSEIDQMAKLSIKRGCVQWQPLPDQSDGSRVRGNVCNCRKTDL